MTTTVIDLDQLHLDSGGHNRREDGVCIMEAVAWYAGEDHSAMPACVSPFLRSFGMSFNDRLPDDRRQELKAFIPKLVGTAGDGRDGRRREIAAEWLLREALPAWLDLAKLTVQAERARTVVVDFSDAEAVRRELRAISTETWRDAAADAAAAAAKYDTYSEAYSAAKKVWLKHIEESDAMAPVRELRDRRIDAGMALYDRLITAEGATA